MAFDCTMGQLGRLVLNACQVGLFSGRSMVALAVDYVCKLGQVASRSV